MSSLETRFFAKVQPASADECWLWRRCMTRSGYGRFGIGNKEVANAHRWVYEFLIADIPAGLVLDHLCHDPDVPPARLPAPALCEPVASGAGHHR